MSLDTMYDDITCITQLVKHSQNPQIIKGPVILKIKSQKCWICDTLEFTYRKKMYIYGTCLQIVFKLIQAGTNHDLISFNFNLFLYITTIHNLQ